MAKDALDPGPLGDYPNLPRNPDGTLDTQRMPVTQRMQHGALVDPCPGVVRNLIAAGVVQLPGT